MSKGLNRTLTRLAAALVAGFVMATVVVSLDAGGALAFSCNDRDERNSVQCMNHGRTQKKGSGNDKYAARKGVRTTIDDRGGVDTLTLSDVRLSEVGLQVKGRDLHVTYRRGRTVIKNHDGKGRIELIKLRGGDRIRFADTAIRLSGPTVRAANLDDRSDVRVRVEPRIGGKAKLDTDNGTLELEFNVGFSIGGDIDLRGVFEAIKSLFTGSGSGGNGGGGSDRTPCNCYDDGWNGGDGVIDDGDYNNNRSGI